MLQVLKRSDDKRYIESQGLRFLVLSSVSDYDTAELSNVDALIMGELGMNESQQLLREIRRSRDKHVYLKPIFSVQSNTTNALGFDGSTDLTNNELIVERTRTILQKTEKVNTSIVPHDYERQNIFKLLAYLFTRDQLLEPVASRHSRIGYTFPFLDSLYSEGVTLEPIELLRKSVSAGALTSKLTDKIHTCNSCQGNYLNFREVCPKCKSVSIEAKDLVHHFKCAHVDVIDHFKDGDEMTCPKCDQKLRHIGIDYDKPSTMHHCNDCHHEFQDSDMIAFCIDCGKEEETSNLLESEINSHAITEKGEHIVLNGMQEESTSSSMDEIKHLSLDLFKMMFNLEVQRAKSEQRSVFGRFEINQSIVSMLGKEGREQFQKEILGIISTYVEPTDLLTTKNAQEYYLLFNDKTIDQATETAQLIEHNLTKLIGDNLNSSEDLVLASIQPVTNELSIESLL